MSVTLRKPFIGKGSTRVPEAIIIGVVLTAVSFLAGSSFGWFETINWLEIFAVFTAFTGTYLCVVEKRINYPINAINTASYCLLFFQQGLFASAILNAYLTPSLLYGWFRWKKDTEARPVTHVAWRWIPVYIAATAVAYLGASLITEAFGGSFAFTDAFILIGTILAQFLLDNKKLETWIIWAVVNVFAIYTYFHAGLFLAAIQYVFFLANSFYGYYVWNRSKNASLSTEGISNIGPGQVQLQIPG